MSRLEEIIDIAARAFAEAVAEVRPDVAERALVALFELVERIGQQQ